MNKKLVIILGAVIIIVVIVAIVVYESTKGDGPVLVLKPKKETLNAASMSEVGGYEWTGYGKGNSFVASNGSCLVGNDIIGFPLLFNVQYLDGQEAKTATTGTVLVCSGCEMEKCGTGNGCTELWIHRVSDTERFKVEYKKNGTGCTVEYKSHIGGRSNVPEEFFVTADEGVAFYLDGDTKKILLQLDMQAKKSL